MNENSGLSGTLFTNSFCTAYTDCGRSSEFRRRQRSTMEMSSEEYRPRNERSTPGILSSLRRWSDSCGGRPDMQAPMLYTSVQGPSSASRLYSSGGANPGVYIG